MVTKLLIKIAKRSPKEYADKILERNETLLEILEGWYNKYLQEELQNYVWESVSLGCPHCGEGYPCESCIWTEVVPSKQQEDDGRFACCHVEFNGHTLEYVANVRDAGFEAVYSHTGATLHYYGPASKKDAKKTYERCKKFLEGHIEWAKLDCWGEEYKENA